jgi:hypothetical protein
VDPLMFIQSSSSFAQIFPETLKGSSFDSLSNIPMYKKIQQSCIGSTGFQQDPSRSSDYFKQNHRSNYKDPTQKTKKYKIQQIKKRTEKASDLADRGHQILCKNLPIEEGAQSGSSEKRRHGRSGSGERCRRGGAQRSARSAGGRRPAPAVGEEAGRRPRSGEERHCGGAPPVGEDRCRSARTAAGQRPAPPVGEEAGWWPGSGEERRCGGAPPVGEDCRRSERKQGGRLAAAPRGRCRGTDEPPSVRVSRRVESGSARVSGPVTRVNSTNIQYEGLRIGGLGRRMNSKVKSVKQGVYQK